MKLVSLTSTSRVDCRGMIRSSSRAAIAPPKPPPAMTTFQAMESNLALCNNLLQSFRTHFPVPAPARRRLGRDRPGGQQLQPELLPDHAVDLAPVGAALGLAHDGPDDRADRLLVAVTDLLGGCGVGVDRGGDYRLQLAAVGNLGQALALDDGGRVAALRHQDRQHRLAAA